MVKVLLLEGSVSHFRRTKIVKQVCYSDENLVNAGSCVDEARDTNKQGLAMDKDMKVLI